MNQQTIVCSNCKTPNPARNLYCQSCGRPLIAASPYPSYPASSDATQPVPSQPPVPVPPPDTPPSPPEYTPPPGPTQQPEYPPPEQQQSVYVPPAYIPPAPQPQVSMQPLYPPPPTAGGPPVYIPGMGVPPTYPPAGAYQQPGPAQPDFFQKTQAKAGSFVSALKKETFNVHVDGWNDLVECEGEKAAEIERLFVDELNGRGLTNIDVEQVEVASGLQQRVYQVVRQQAGSVSVYASAAGKDLMLGWDENVVQKPSWKRMGILLLAAFILSFLVNLSIGYSPIFFLGRWIFDTFGQLITVAILGLIAGQVMKGDLWYMFIEKPEAAARQELMALAVAVHQCLVAAARKAGIEATSLRGKDIFIVS